LPLTRHGEGRQVTHRGETKHALRLGVLAALVVIVLSACGGGGGGGEQGGGGGGQAKQEQAKVRKLPEYGDLRPGKYVTDEFEPDLSFGVVGEGWVVVGPEERGVFDMQLRVGGPLISFANVQKVFDPSKLSDLIPVPAPEDMVAWLQKHPYLETEEPEPVSVGGVKGTQIDAVVADDVPTGECGDNCLGLFSISREIDWGVYEKERVRFVVLEDVGGERVIISAETLATDFEGFLPKAQKVLDSVEWEGV
jgi:hypothetical protein